MSAVSERVVLQEAIVAAWAKEGHDMSKMFTVAGIAADVALATRDTRIAQLEAERAASVERRAAYMGVEKIRAERDEAYALLEEARPYLVAMEDVVDDPRGEGVRPNEAMRLVNEIDRLIGGAK